VGKEDKTILIISEDDRLARSFARVLQKNDYKTEIVPTGKDAIQKTRLKRYNLVLIDVCRQELQSPAFLGKLDDHGGKIIKIVITAAPTTMPWKAAGADAYILKPVNPQELLTIIKQKTQN
jgi:two-component system response regulator HydG